jgi:hypothetical protein
MLATLVALAAIPAAPAAALDPPQASVGGNNSQWISGDLLSQTGLNCSTAILGSAYTEIMVQGIASYGGLPSVPKVGDGYWTAFLVSIPGNPCGPGSTSVVTTLVMPPYTDVDSSRQIRCFGLPRSASGWQELTGQSWSFLGQSGPYCPTGPTPSPYHSGGQQFGFRPLASGQMFWIFVPVKSTQPLIGAQRSPADGFRWLTDATGVYANPGLSTVWANVFAAGSGGDPFVYFARDPTTIPYWKDDAPNDPDNPLFPGITTKSRVEWFANLYSAGKTGSFCWQLFKGANDGTPDINACSGFPGWNPTIDTSGELWQVFGSGTAAGPNGGYSPLYYDDDPPNTLFTLRWVFNPDVGPDVAKETTFRTLSGPDQDGDGVANNGADACPTVKGTLANGCLPGVQEDGDKDGVYGAADLCPSLDGAGALNGCPGGIVADPPKPPVLIGLLKGISSKTVFKRAALSKGALVKFTCTVDSSGKGALSITAKVAKTLRIKTTKRQKTVGIASGKGQCTVANGGKLKLKLVKKYAAKVKRARKKFPAALSIKLTAPGQAPVTMKRGVRVG